MSRRAPDPFWWALMALALESLRRWIILRPAGNKERHALFTHEQGGILDD